MIRLLLLRVEQLIDSIVDILTVLNMKVRMTHVSSF